MSEQRDAPMDVDEWVAFLVEEFPRTLVLCVCGHSRGLHVFGGVAHCRWGMRAATATGGWLHCDCDGFAGAAS